MNPNQKKIKGLLDKGRLNETTMQNYWAAYMNMARHNLFMTLQFISRSMGCLPKQSQEEANEDKILDMAILNWKIELSPEDEEKARTLLLKHFPFLKTPRKRMSAKEHNDDTDYKESILTFADLRQTLFNIAATLSKYRNRYSHSRAKLREIAPEKYCGNFLSNLLVISRRLVRERYRANKNTAQIGMIDENSFKFITEGVVLKDRATGKMVFAKDYYLNTLNNDEKLTDFGKLFLTCILIEKKYATELLSQCHFLDAFNDDAPAPKLSEWRLMLEVMTAMRVRLPEKKLNAEKQDIQVALDILNELKKCPEEVYELLGDEDKSLFNVTADTGETVLLKRHSDRFTQLALSYLDSSESFSSIRFQVNAGKFRYLFRDEKHCIDGRTRPRVLEEPLNAYRRLMELEKERTGKQVEGQNGLWDGFRILTEEESPRNDSSVLPYITDSAARYVFDGDNINILFGDFTPEINLAENGRYRVAGKIADCAISRYELPALLFYHILTTKYWAKSAKYGMKSTEDIIKTTVSSYRKFFLDIKEGRLAPIPGENRSAFEKRIKTDYGISLSDIPDKLNDYLTGNQKNAVSNAFAKWKKGQIEVLKEETEYKIKRLKDIKKQAALTDNKMGKRGYVFLKPGAYASFVASDIVFFQECEATRKMTGLNFKVMQSCLATFQEHGSTSFDDILAMFRKANLITVDNAEGNHPFLYKVIGKRPKDMVEFYEDYLVERKVYLGGPIPDDVVFLHSERKRWEQRTAEYYRDLAGRYLERPVQLPRQLFEQPVRDILLSGALGNEGESLGEVIREAYDGGRCNTAFMVIMYFYEYLDDCPQFFYGLSEGDLDHSYNYRFYALIRDYPEGTRAILKKLGGDKKISAGYRNALSQGINWASKNPKIEGSSPKRNSAVKLSEEELKEALKKAYRQMMENEKLLRRYAVQDAVLFLAAKNIIGAVSRGNFNLCDIKPQGDSILEQPVTVKTKTRNGAVISQENVKIKDYGKIYKLLNDRRVDDLLARHRTDEVKMGDLTEELAHYDRNRVAVFGSILNYERKISKDKSDAELLDKVDYVNFNEIQKLDKQNSGENKRKLHSIRNAFSHNQYPQEKYKPAYYGTEIPGAADEITQTVNDIEKGTK